MITPKEIETKIFKKAAFGYDKDDVDQFLDMVIMDYEKALEENRKNKEQLDELNESVNYYRSIERSLQSTLALGQKTADDTVRQAEEEKLRVEREARLEVEKMRLEAKESEERHKKAINELMGRFLAMKDRLRSMLSSELEVLDKFEIKTDDIFIDEKTVAAALDGKAEEPEEKTEDGADAGEDSGEASDAGSEESVQSAQSAE